MEPLPWSDLVAELQELEVAVADLEASAETPDELAELERLTERQMRLYREICAVMAKTTAG